jgi:NAD(P)-dependent dehydrogenase (short-subunit alcohol dehydrogenase family)
LPRTEIEPVAVVSGGNRGIGREVCRLLVERGYEVILGSRDIDKGVKAIAELGAPSGLRAEQLDVTDDESCAALAEDLDRLDVLVNNAAIGYDTWEDASDADLVGAQRTFDTNFFGAWRLTQALLPKLRRSPHPRIVNVSSGAGSLASMGAGVPAYATSKAALNALTRVLAAELRRDGILVNAVCPGWVATDMGGPGGRPIGDGAASVVWAATLPDDGPTGGFFRDGRPLRW